MMPLPELAYTISALRWYWLAAAAGLLLLAGLGMALAGPRIRRPRATPASPVAAEALATEIILNRLATEVTEPAAHSEAPA